MNCNSRILQLPVCTYVYLSSTVSCRCYFLVSCAVDMRKRPQRARERGREKCKLPQTRRGTRQHGGKKREREERGEKVEIVFSSSWHSWRHAKEFCTSCPAPPPPPPRLPPPPPRTCHVLTSANLQHLLPWVGGRKASTKTIPQSPPPLSLFLSTHGAFSGAPASTVK